MAKSKRVRNYNNLGRSRHKLKTKKKAGVIKFTMFRKPLPKKEKKENKDEKDEKAEYERRLHAGLELNKKILEEQTAEIKRLEMSGIDGPYRRTRSNVRPRTDPGLKKLRKERDYTKQAIWQINNEVQKMKNGRPIVMPVGFTNYTDFLKGGPNWDMQRMTYVKRDSPSDRSNS